MSTKTAAAAVADPLEPVPVLVGRPDDRALTASLTAPALEPTRRGWLVLLGVLMAKGVDYASAHWATAFQHSTK